MPYVHDRAASTDVRSGSVPAQSGSKTSSEYLVRKKMGLHVAILILSVSAVIVYGYFNRVEEPYHDWRVALHKQIIAGTAPSPFRYRVLVPFSVEVLTKGFSPALSSKAAFCSSYLAYDVVAVCFSLGMLFLWLRAWFGAEQSLVGVLFVASTMPIALQDHFYQPWSLLEGGLFSAALLAIHGRRYWLLIVLMILASLNRETAIFIALMFWVTAKIDARSLLARRRMIDWRPVLELAGLLAIWGLTFGGLRLVRGGAPSSNTVAGLLAMNTSKSGLLHAVLHGSLFLGGFWIFACLGFRKAPEFIRRAALIVPPYILLVLVYGRWLEVRLLMPLYPVLVPLGLSYLYSRRDEGSVGSSLGPASTP